MSIIFFSYELNIFNSNSSPIEKFENLKFTKLKYLLILLNYSS